MKEIQAILRMLSPWTGEDEIESILAGNPPTRSPFGYRREGKKLVPVDAGTILQAFQMKAEGKSYAQVAAFLGQSPLSKGPTGRGWNKERVRTWMSSPVHAGFAARYLEQLPDGSANKRGPVALIPISQRALDAPVSLDLWLRALPTMARRVQFPLGRERPQ